MPAGFADETVWSGLDHPMAIAFASNGQVFVAEKRGTIQRFDSLSDPTPTLFADLNVNVHNWWDRGMMGLAVDPGSRVRPAVRLCPVRVQPHPGQRERRAALALGRRRPVLGSMPDTARLDRWVRRLRPAVAPDLARAA